MLTRTPQGLGKPGGDNVTTLESAGAEGTAAKTQMEERTQGEEQKTGAAKKKVRTPSCLITTLSKYVYQHLNVSEF